ncbi:type II toxin-antitoxin system VapC family toxin [Sphaerospermopsis aphanizomenoides BCCUSP55]|uniref:type II toxin-antitoxin system VapC family toxin n=1 Tax=Sphaerospermopsis aphanizomenoides TaxID=459663 RepID=UPI000A4DEAE4|nr:PIN domain-containing protein [Sphaerospermopsis aphanizomenoides]MBK1986987.1 type II toxin-antitoxin system VapC family toxin [Sphaerospermopsis aphanizomenoides BCCUSP55]
MSYLVDTNILLRLVQKNNPMNPDAQRAIVTLKQKCELLYIIPQNLIEFWAVATRPINSNGLGLTIIQAAEETEKLKKIFTLQTDTPEIFIEWESLVIKHQVMGKQVHDARLVAAMVTHKITHLLTFNIDDFKRFSEIVVVDARSFAP